MTSNYEYMIRCNWQFFFTKVVEAKITIWAASYVTLKYFLCNARSRNSCTYENVHVNNEAWNEGCTSKFAPFYQHLFITAKAILSWCYRTAFLSSKAIQNDGTDDEEEEDNDNKLLSLKIQCINFSLLSGMINKREKIRIPELQHSLAT